MTIQFDKLTLDTTDPKTAAALERITDRLALIEWGQSSLHEKLNLLTAKETTDMADFATDEARLESDVQAESAAIAQVQQAVTANTQALADANAQIAALKAQGVDTTAMETALATLESNNTALQGIGQPAPAPTPAPAPATPTDPAAAQTDPNTPAVVNNGI